MANVGSRMTHFAVKHPRKTLGAAVISAGVLVLVAALPSMAPGVFTFLNPVAVDTDPENMLSADEPARVFHNQTKADFGIHDILVLGVVNDRNPEGVFNSKTLSKVHLLTEHASTLPGVIAADLLSPSTVDSIENAGPGTVRFDWLMKEPPTDDQEARDVRARMMRIPFLKDTLASSDGKALALYISLESKDVAYRVSQALRTRAAALEGHPGDQFHITGLPVAEDTFGIEMFKQMAISAPTAMAVIFLLMWVFFRKVVVIASPMIVALIAAATTMSLLVITGNTIHIMSSMIPIFIMPIAVLDSVHIISDVFDRYQKGTDRQQLITEVMDDLGQPMLFTSLTTTAGFASLALTPIPPVQVFGIFVGFGVLAAWFWTVTFIPAFLILLPERALVGFGLSASNRSPRSRLLDFTNQTTHRRAHLILGGTLVLLAVAAVGISRIQINDNPTKWFTKEHPIRVADRVLNDHFAGTYQSYLVLEAAEQAYVPKEFASLVLDASKKAWRSTRNAFAQVQSGLDADAEPSTLIKKLDTLDREHRSQRASLETPEELIAHTLVSDFLGEQFERVEEGEISTPGALSTALNETLARHQTALTREAESGIEKTLRKAPTSPATFLRAFRKTLPESPALGHVIASLQSRGEVFKRPDVLKYVEEIQAMLKDLPMVGKSSSLADIVKTVHRDLVGTGEEAYRIPGNRQIVAQTLQQYQSSHRKDDLWHFVTPGYDKALLWIQLNSGDNQEMTKLLAAAENFFENHPGPVKLQSPRWAGLTYINEVWQDKMVSGMGYAFLSSFVVVLLMMVGLFRSVLWGVLSMVPLTVTVTLIYGLIGLIGKEYDMPVAVLSSLSLGLAVDYAIHFLARTRALIQKHGSWEKARAIVFEEPARAIARNIVVVGAGFLPLLLAPLLPYRTVGFLIAAILVTAGAATLLILPSLVRTMENPLCRKITPATSSSMRRTP